MSESILEKLYNEAELNYRLRAQSGLEYMVRLFNGNSPNPSLNNLTISNGSENNFPLTRMHPRLVWSSQVVFSRIMQLSFSAVKSGKNVARTVRTVTPFFKRLRKGACIFEMINYIGLRRPLRRFMFYLDHYDRRSLDQQPGKT